MILNETYTLHNGLPIPKLGLGTWLIKNDLVAEAVRNAVELGYRHIDTARVYRNESGVGEGIRSCGVSREEIFVTTKIAAEAKSYESAKICVDESLKMLGMDYIDMILVHAPQPWLEWRDPEKRYFPENTRVWRALEDAYREGKVRAIGVSNFLNDDLQNILEHCSIKPMVNQILAHIGNTPFEIMDLCEKHGILVEAYSPIAHGMALENGEIAAMAAKYRVSVAQLCIRYVLQLNTVALPKAANPLHAKANADVDFVISEEDMASLRSVAPYGYGEHTSFPVFSGK